MAETTDQESKTEEPTEKKVRDALEQGKIPVSREASIFASMAALMVIQAFLIGQGVQQLTPMLTGFLDDLDGFPLSTGADAQNLLIVVGLQALRFLTPLVVTLAAFGLAASLLQNAPSLVLQRITPDLSRISPLGGWSRLFGSQGLVEFAKSLFKLAAVTVVVAFVLRSSEAKAFEAMYTDPVALPEMILNIAMRIVSAICIATIVLVAVDLAWARFHWRRELRMTRQEIKDEHKQAEGDPLIKARLRSLARDRSRQRMIASASRATLVIANPTHFAIALRYNREENPAPIVVAKGMDVIALKIREVAEQNRIPVIENKALARALYEAVQVDQVIPAEFFRPVAEIIYFLQSKQTPQSEKVQ
ncbi:flagellar biosynthetic protein FlhB [Bradyrhizobium sp. GM2.2]|jgi:flagellar biosynthetic protein FlhB|uniref:flagellar biosynthesis protein FlhB n=1 Tax=unclassified Bradyrhizobium TaxID=2631580 RepID=UPI001FF976D8|nr:MULTISPECIES: flagellar biosynthesis protein FlhB [unclassified Bradyrhizobium]MCK1271316.1 flagellar biosynthesis protein FlhB [Bradyrhizobium sp. 84]MCK1308962.1 flagellar biosynthesis protein FlhB [Bradyrhizobium sp. 45]MCK1375635.1 flagellar biosynthesis protein FlhB [Bradyrhizobium sp. 49]MCK1426991.1 flagellar biosynthesis protein FlhB [Bradyrhizobium sp. 87]MCK1439112.1 flagellar biosynthesis protein FlhB [Bradyrhizobium sp. 15]